MDQWGPRPGQTAGTLQAVTREMPIEEMKSVSPLESSDCQPLDVETPQSANGVPGSGSGRCLGCFTGDNIGSCCEPSRSVRALNLLTGHWAGHLGCACTALPWLLLLSRWTLTLSPLPPTPATLRYPACLVRFTLSQVECLPCSQASPALACSRPTPSPPTTPCSPPASATTPPASSSPTSPALATATTTTCTAPT